MQDPNCELESIDGDDLVQAASIKLGTDELPPAVAIGAKFRRERKKQGFHAVALARRTRLLLPDDVEAIELGRGRLSAAEILAAALGVQLRIAPIAGSHFPRICCRALCELRQKHHPRQILGEKLRAVREGLAVSLAGLARRIGLQDAAAIEQLECGRDSWLSTAEAASRELGLKLILARPRQRPD